MFIHGYGGHSGLFDAFFAKLCAAGIAVRAYDCVGSGRSPPHPTRGRWNCERFGDLVEDAAAFVRLAVADEAPLPVFVLGFSLGGLVAAHALVAGSLRDTRVAGLILSSAAIDIRKTRAQAVLACFGALLSAFFPDSLVVPTQSPSLLSRDPCVGQRYIADPLTRKGKGKARMANETLRAFAWLHARRSLLRLPILAHHGTCDAFTDVGAVQALLDGCGSSDARLVRYEGAYHDLTQESCAPEVTATTIEWVLSRSAQQPTK